MIFYDKEVQKSVQKKLISREVFERFNNAFIALDVTGDLGLFDIKKLKSSEKRTYYRLRKGKYRAIFYLENNNYYVVSLAKREEVYYQWE